MDDLTSVPLCPHPMHFARRPEPHASKGLPVTSDDLVPQILAAIEETERLASALISTVNPTTGEWVPAGPHGTEIRDSRDHLVVKHSWPDEIAHIIRHDPAAVLRRCAADRRRLERHTPDTTGDGYFYCTTCGGGGKHEFPVEWPCEDLLDVADSYGVAPESHTVRGVDLSGIDLGEPSQAEQDRIAGILAQLPTATLTFEGTFNDHTEPREHEDGPDCWCKPIGPTYVHHDLLATDPASQQEAT